MQCREYGSWAETEDGLLNSVRDLAVGLLHKRELAFVREWRLPEKLEKLTIIVWHNDCPEAEAIGELGDAEGLLKALAACMRRNRQHRTFKLLELRAVSALPKKLYQQLKEVQEMQPQKYLIYLAQVGFVLIYLPYPQLPPSVQTNWGFHLCCATMSLNYSI